MSKEQRALIEEDLKSGRLPAVVATSSLELGIDMGAVDLVDPGRVAAVGRERPAARRPGRAPGRRGHARASCFPKYRGDLVQTAVVAERMRDGLIEEMRMPRNPLDVLAQQVVAMCALDEWHVDDVLALVRRAAPFATLPQSAFDAVLDMLAGRYPSDEFAELRPRLVWDRTTRHAHRPPGRAAARGHERRHDPRPRPVRRVPRRARRRRASASSTRRWSTSRASATCSRSARRAGGSRTSPTTGCWSRPRPGVAGPAAVLARRRARPARPSSAERSARSSARCGALPRGRREQRLSGSGLDEQRRRPTCSPTSTSSARRPATCPTTARSWSSGSATSSATGGSSCTPRSARRCTRRGRWRSAHACASGSASTRR